MEQEKTILEDVNEVNDDVFFDDESELDSDDDMFVEEGIEQATEDEPEDLEVDRPTSQIKIKYNGEEEVLDLESQYEDIVSLIQKGKNYDHVLTERDSLKDNPTIKELQEIAKQVGVNDVDGLLAKLKTDIRETQINNRMQELIDDGMSEKHARQLAETELKAKEKEVQPLAQPEDKQPDDNLEKEKQMFVELFEEYPELIKLKFEDYPQEVVKMIEEGKTPLVAYQKYLLDKEREFKQKLEHQADVKKRNVGSLKTAKAEDADDFLSTFDD